LSGQKAYADIYQKDKEINAKNHLQAHNLAGNYADDMFVKIVNDFFAQ